MGSFTYVYKSKSIIKMVKSIGMSPDWIWHYSVAVCKEKLSCPVVSCCEHWKIFELNYGCGCDLVLFESVEISFVFCPNFGE